MKLTLREVFFNEFSVTPQNKMSPAQLFRLQSRLDEMFESGEIDYDEYIKQWDDVLRASGWSETEYADEIDRRWDYIDADQSFVPEISAQGDFGPN